MKVQVLYFSGCPNHDRTVELVREVARELRLSVEVEEVEVITEDDATRLRFLGSPSVHVKGIDVEPSARSSTALVIDVQTKRLALEQRRGALISRDRAIAKAFSFARMLRDAWLTWPARIGPQLAADLGVEPAVLVIALEERVREHLAELASERVEF